ncbi:uncharacterized protein LOC142317517 [Lycorma delicatula]|uniref:uncharacterized protein LOC142317517 n=1 Tax=Lycorma delicatula TaxID=130591 RepID=UPI003F510D44
MGKVVEKMLAGRIVQEVEEDAGIGANQYGFWRGRSTVHAINRVVNWADEARSGTWRTRNIPLLVSLDVKNAFGSIAWKLINTALVEKGISPYLRRQEEEYLRDRRCAVSAQEEEVRFSMCCATRLSARSTVMGPGL